jgi:hypothetical protein
MAFEDDDDDDYYYDKDNDHHHQSQNENKNQLNKRNDTKRSSYGIATHTASNERSCFRHVVHRIIKKLLITFLARVIRPANHAMLLFLIIKAPKSHKSSFIKIALNFH